MARSTTKGEPFSVRLSAATDRAVTEEARRVKRAKGAVLEALADEALRMRRFPGIAFRGTDADRRPWVIGSALDVWEICELVDGYGSIEALVADVHVTERQARLALAYRTHYPEEIAAAIAENNRPIEEWRALYPLVRVDDAAS